MGIKNRQGKLLKSLRYCTENNQYYFGVRNEDAVWKIDPIHNDEETAIDEWFEFIEVVAFMFTLIVSHNL